MRHAETIAKTGGNEQINEIEIESQRAAMRLLMSLEKAESIETKDDKKSNQRVY